MSPHKQSFQNDVDLCIDKAYFTSMVSSLTSQTQMLPQDRRFQDLLLPFLLPYLLYVAISSLPETMVAAETAQLFKLVAVGAAMLFFRRSYRFGTFKPVHLAISIAALPVAMLFWIGPFYLLSMMGLFDVTRGGNAFSALFFYLRLINTVLLVAVFEELFMRVYVMGWFFQAGLERNKKGFLGAVLDVLEQRPMVFPALPVSRFSVIGSTIVFTAGHHTHEYLSCSLYFLFTTWLYKKSGSLWVCIILHGLSNLSIALLVNVYGMAWLW